MSDPKNIKKEYEIILEKLSDPELISNWEKGDESKNSSSPFAGARVFEELLKRKSFLEKIIEKEKEIEDLKNEIEENKEISKSHEDKDLSSLAETEIIQLSEKLKNLEEEIQKLSSEGEENKSSSSPPEALAEVKKRVPLFDFAVARVNKENDGPKAIIVEIRAGTGGQEAALFAADLFRMYSKYAQIKEWKQKVLDSRPAELGGFKEIIFEIKDGNIWPFMKNEAGVHRVQRIPTTEKSGRVHTSTVSVAVLPKPKKGKIAINPRDLKIDTYKASGPGGQYVNKRETAIRITHLPTNTIVTSQTERSLQQNKENALSILEAKILEKKIKEEEKKLKDERKTQIGKADRSEKIRTYNFPQNRVTDHRIKKSFHNIEEIMEGKLEPIISALQKLKY